MNYLIVTLLIFFILSGCASKPSGINAFVKTENSINLPSKLVEEVSDKEKLEIAKQIIATTKINFRNICQNKKTIYISTNNLPNYVLENFPKKIEDCKVDFVDISKITKNFNADYHELRDWKKVNSLVYVVSSTKFWSGNSGATTYTLNKKDGKWLVELSNSFAAAS